MTIEIEGLTKAQEIALEDILAQMVALGNVGASRWVCFYADGDGNFHPKIRVGGPDGHNPQFYGDAATINARWLKDEYRMDFDSIAWALRENEDHSK
jgi:hypothetical protein